MVINPFLVRGSAWGMVRLCERGLREYPVSRIGGSNLCRTCPGSNKTVEKRASSALAHNSSIVGVEGGRYPWRLSLFSSAVMRSLSPTVVNPHQEGEEYSSEQAWWSAQ